LFVCLFLNPTSLWKGQKTTVICLWIL
jgi:hypothetical protein